MARIMPPLVVPAVAADIAQGGLPRAFDSAFNRNNPEAKRILQSGHAIVAQTTHRWRDRFE
jgi:hypothetical protein